jgi:hypothetical protein
MVAKKHGSLSHAFFVDDRGPWYARPRPGFVWRLTVSLTIFAASGLADGDHTLFIRPERLLMRNAGSIDLAPQAMRVDVLASTR